jgi:hypothetical protein
MNHLTALAITITAFSSGLYGIYKFFRAKYVSYDITPIHYWSNKKQRVKKRYKTFKNRKRKHLTLRKIGLYSKYGNTKKAGIKV